MKIIYLDLDSLRPDHLGCYGYHRNTSPNIDSIANEGVRFTDCYASDIPCCPSRTAMMTAQFGIHNGLICHYGSAGDVHHEGATRGFISRLSKETLPGFLRNHGHYTASISPFPERHGAWTFNAGFMETINTGMCGMESAEDVTPTALDWINRNANQNNWFLHLNYWDPHMPSRVPEGVPNPFENEPLSDFYTQEEIDRQLGLIGAKMPHIVEKTYFNYNQGNVRPRWPGAPNRAYPRCPEQIRTMGDIKKIVDEYDASIHYLDSHLGQIFDACKQAGIWDDLTIVINADHGENLGELGIYGDHRTADYITTHIPLIVRHPGGKQGHVDTGLHYHLDLAPTLAELIGQAPLEVWDGASYAPAILNGNPCGHKALVVSAGWGTAQRSVRSENWFYTHTYHDGYNLFPEIQLYDVNQDAHQIHNIAEAHPEVCQNLESTLVSWRDQMLDTMPYAGTPDPMDVVLQQGGPIQNSVLTGLIENLEENGRMADVQKVCDRYASEL